MNPYLENAKAFLGRLSLGQKLAISFVLVGGIVILSLIAYWAGKPDLQLLFASLNPSDANKVVEALQADKVPYELRENGTAIYVPRGEVYELRLRFAGEGLVSDGPLGYELFDKGTLGMTDFMQKLNFKRALEGELARTISNVRQVDVARVHLVIPERSPFREMQNQPSASVVLQLASNAGLGQDQIDGISALVSGAVEGLAPSNVTVLDTRGNLLSNPNAGNADALISSTQLKHQRAIEQHLTEKGQSMLDQMVGPGNSIVRVAATVDFSRSVKEHNLIDPESATVVAEERQDTQAADDQANASIRNYELSRTLERIEETGGTISHLTVSVILNAKKVPGEPGGGEDAAFQFVMHPEAELQEIESIVKNAVGYRDDRGDRFAIHQTRFDTSVDDRIAEDIRDQRQQEQYQLYLRYGLMVLAMGLAFWLIRSASRRMSVPADDVRYLGESLQTRQIGGKQSGGDALEGGENYKELEAHDEEEDVVMVDDVFSSKLSPEAKARLKAKHLMYEEIKKSVVDQPGTAADLLRSWIVEDQVAKPV